MVLKDCVASDKLRSFSVAVEAYVNPLLFLHKLMMESQFKAGSLATLPSSRECEVDGAGITAEEIKVMALNTILLRMERQEKHDQEQWASTPPAPSALVMETQLKKDAQPQQKQLKDLVEDKFRLHKGSITSLSEETQSSLGKAVEVSHTFVAKRINCNHLKGVLSATDILFFLFFCIAY